jgi:hypothetical protein
MTEAMALVAVLANGDAVGSLRPNVRRLVTNRGWLAKPPRRGAPWQVNAAGITALRRVDQGDQAIRLRVDALHVAALTEARERMSDDRANDGRADV